MYKIRAWSPYRAKPSSLPDLDNWILKGVSADASSLETDTRYTGLSFTRAGSLVAPQIFAPVFAPDESQDIRRNTEYEVTSPADLFTWVKRRNCTPFTTFQATTATFLLDPPNQVSFPP